MRLAFGRHWEYAGPAKISAKGLSAFVSAFRFDVGKHRVSVYVVFKSVVAFLVPIGDSDDAVRGVQS
jgi:hypothetical protein